MGTTVVKRNASNIDLQRAIEAAIPTAVKQMKQRSNQFKGATEIETCKKIFDYLKNQVNYKADGAEQQVRLPSGLIRTLQGDCKSYSVFTSAVLTNLGIPHKLVYAAYDPQDSTPTHIYVMTNKGCIIDAVYGKFNAEKQATNKKYKNMNISYIAGIKPRPIGLTVDTKAFPYHLYITIDGKSRHVNSFRTRSAADKTRRMYREDVKPRVSTKYIGSMGKYGTGGACGIGGVDTGRDWAEKLGIWKDLPGALRIEYTVALINPIAIAGRETIKALLRKNAGGMANSLARIYNIARADNSTPEFKKYREIELNYLSKGGNPDDFRVAFQEGNTKTPTGAYFNKLMKMKAGGYTPNIAQWIAAGISVLFGKKYNESTGQITGNDLGIGEPVATGTLLSGAPVWVQFVAYTTGVIGSAAVVAVVANAMGEGGNTPGGETPPPTPPPVEEEKKSFLLPILLVGGAAAAYFILKPSKK